MDGFHAQYPKTKQQIRTTFLKMLETESYRQIRIKEIVKDLSRQTFYLYYDSKEYLLEEIIGDLAHGLTSIMVRSYDNGIELLMKNIVDENCPVFVEYFRYGRKYSKNFLILLNPENDTDFRLRFSRYMDEYKEQIFEQWIGMNHGPQPGDPLKKKLYQNGIDAFILNFFSWIERGFEPSEEEMAAHHARLWMTYTPLYNTGADIIVSTMMRELSKKQS